MLPTAYNSNPQMNSTKNRDNGQDGCNLEGINLKDQPKGFRISHINIQSIKNKIDEVIALLNTLT